MKIIKIDYKNPDRRIIKKVAEIINRGGIAIVPGDAVYTIVADAFNKEAVKKVSKLKKGRGEDKAFNLGLYSFGDIQKYARFHPLINKIQEKFPKEPFTFAVPRNKNLPKFLNPKFKTVGFRVPFNKVTLGLSNFHRTPVIGTSANISELPEAHSVEELLDYFRGIFGKDFQPDLILDAGKLKERKPSTVIELAEGKRVRILREGEVKKGVLEKEIKRLQKNLDLFQRFNR